MRWANTIAIATARNSSKKWEKNEIALLAAAIAVDPRAAASFPPTQLRQAPRQAGSHDCPWP